MDGRPVSEQEAGEGLNGSWSEKLLGSLAVSGGAWGDAVRAEEEDIGVLGTLKNSLDVSR